MKQVGIKSGAFGGEIRVATFFLERALGNEMYESESDKGGLRAILTNEAHRLRDNWRCCHETDDMFDVSTLSTLPRRHREMLHYAGEGTRVGLDLT